MAAAVADVGQSETAVDRTDHRPRVPQPSIWSSFSDNDLQLVSSKVLAICDALDGLADGMITDVTACQAAFSFDRDVPACASGVTPNVTCLISAQKAVLADILRGPRDSKGSVPISVKEKGDGLPRQSRATMPWPVRFLPASSPGLHMVTNVSLQMLPRR